MKGKFEKGITLVSLVITIIVLIILAAVSINVIVGQDGIITKAKQAAQNMELATVQEQERLNELSGYLSGENIEGGLAYDKIAELNQKYNNLNKEFTNFKTQIAQAITDKGVATSETDSVETMISNIRSISVSNSLDISEIKSRGYINPVENLFRHGAVTKTVTLTHSTEILSITVWNEGTIPTVSVDSETAEISLLDTAIYNDCNKTYVYLIKGKIGQTYTYTINGSGGHDGGHRIAYYGNYSTITKVSSINTYGNEWTITLPYDGKYILMIGGMDGSPLVRIYSLDGAIKVTEGTDKSYYNNSAVFYIEGVKDQTLTLTLDNGGLTTAGSLLYIN